jgi:ribA/ribD-fused uncharacterized protein
VKEVRGFFGDYRFLSNFHPSPFTIGGVEYATVEHFFQASKAANKEDHDYVNSADSPGVAKHRGRRITLREDWERVKLRVMRIGLNAKFAQNPELKTKLTETGVAYLEETNNWGDTFWGRAGGKGFNHLGEMLMEIRDANRMQVFYE